MRDTRAALESTGVVPTANMTVGAWLDAWLDMADVRPTTLGSYRSTVRTYLAPKLGRIRLDRLAPAHIRDMLDWIVGAHPDGLGLSVATQARAFRVLRTALAAAVMEGVLASNPCARVRATSSAPTADAYLSADDATTLMRATWDDPLGPRWATALLTGARQGETIGMEWARVDLVRGVIDVSWQLQRLPWAHGCPDVTRCPVRRAGSCPDRQLDVRPGYVLRQLDGGLCLTRPKTAAGTRLIPISDPLRAILAKQAAWQRGRPNPHGLVFTRGDGRPIDPSRDSEAWHVALEQAGLPPVKLHAARHTAATLLMRAGVDIKVIQAVMGHTTASVSRGYLHADTSMASLAMSSMASLLGELPAS